VREARCRTLDSTNTGKHGDNRPFDHIVINGGSFGVVLATRLFKLDRTQAHRIVILGAGPLALLALGRL
jgi:hypothetical protein